MDEAKEAVVSSRFSFLRKKIKSKSGQAIVEFLLILMLTVGFTRFIYFHPRYGFKGIIDHTMLKVGTLLERDLKTGTRTGGRGVNPTEQYMGTSTWKN